MAVAPASPSDVQALQMQLQQEQLALQMQLEQLRIQQEHIRLATLQQPQSAGPAAAPLPGSLPPSSSTSGLAPPAKKPLPRVPSPGPPSRAAPSPTVPTAAATPAAAAAGGGASHSPLGPPPPRPAKDPSLLAAMGVGAASAAAPAVVAAGASPTLERSMSDRAAARQSVAIDGAVPLTDELEDILIEQDELMPLAFDTIQSDPRYRRLLQKFQPGVRPRALAAYRRAVLTLSIFSLWSLWSLLWWSWLLPLRLCEPVHDQEGPAAAHQEPDLAVELTVHWRALLRLRHVYDGSDDHRAAP